MLGTNLLKDRKVLLLAIQTPDISDSDTADSLRELEDGYGRQLLPTSVPLCLCVRKLTASDADTRFESARDSIDTRGSTWGLITGDSLSQTSV